MKRVTLLFPDTKSLWAFAQNLLSSYIEIDSGERKLICNCSDLEISKAIIEYSAEIIDEVQERKR